MTAQELIQTLIDVLPGMLVPDEETKSLLREISGHLSILTEPYRARQPPVENTSQEAESKRVIIERPSGEKIDVTWLMQRPMYENSQFCRIFNIQPPTAQKWRSQRKIKYFKIGNIVWYPVEEIIELIRNYVSGRRFTITQIELGDTEDFQPINNY